MMIWFSAGFRRFGQGYATKNKFTRRISPQEIISGELDEL
jgi:hypothetical protein